MKKIQVSDRNVQSLKDLVRKERKSVSDLFRSYIIDYVESRNAKVERSITFSGTLPPIKRLMLEQKPQDPYPESREDRENWIKKYPRRTTVNYGK